MEQNVSARLFAVVRSSCEPFSPSSVENSLEYTLLKIWFQRKVKNAFGVRWGDKRFRSFLPLSCALFGSHVNSKWIHNLVFCSACYRVSFFIITFPRAAWERRSRCGISQCRWLISLLLCPRDIIICEFMNFIAAWTEFSKWEIISPYFHCFCFSELFKNSSRNFLISFAKRKQY